MNNRPVIIDLFCGIGGLSRGFELAGFETVLAIDMWEDAINTFNYNHAGNVGHVMDIHSLNRQSIKELTGHSWVDGIIGGPPCQGFSTVGTRDVADPRNGLYLEFWRMVDEMRPNFFVIENVRGLLTLGGGVFQQDIVERFGKIGYKVTWKLVDAADYGVPQFRKRVFFVGTRTNSFVFPEAYDFQVSSFQAISDLPGLDNLGEYPETFSYGENDFLSDYAGQMRDNSQGVYNHNYTFHSPQTISVISMVGDGGKISDLPPEYWSIRKYNKSFQRMNSSLPSHTIDTGHRNYFHYKENRVPSVRECCRLQSFSDSYIILGSKTSQYKQVGNAVPPLLARAIAQEINNQVIHQQAKLEIQSSLFT